MALDSAARHWFSRDLRRFYLQDHFETLFDSPRAVAINAVPQCNYACRKCQYHSPSITNPGAYGSLFNLPVINQPQVGILGVGGVEKRAVVVDDMIAMRTRAYLSLSFDHRLVDGAVADQFMGRIKRELEGFDEACL